jgi:exopolysaccharide biosynthesis protein
MQKIFCLAILSLATCSGALAQASSHSASSKTQSDCSTFTNKKVADGLTWSRMPFSATNPSCVNVLTLDFHSKLRIRAKEAVGPCRKVSQLAQESSIVAAVNGGFFCYGTPSLCTYNSNTCPRTCTGFSMLKMSGQLKSENCSPNSKSILRATLGWNDEATPVIKLIQSGVDWPEIQNAVGAGPTLVLDSKVNVPDNEGFPWLYSAYPRTAVGLIGDTQLVLVTVDKSGVTLPDLAKFLLNQLHVTNAMNLDGGGSTTMVINHKVVNHPSDSTGERSIYDAIVIESPLPVASDKH